MAQQRGAYAPIIIGTESAFGTQATAGQKLYYKSESLKYSRNLISSETLRGSRQPIRPMRGNVDVTGDVTVELGPQHGLLIKHALGSYTPTGGPVYVHTFTIGDLPPGLTIEKQFIDLDTDRYFRYTGCKVNSWKVSMKTEGPIESTFSFMGRGETLATSSMDGSASDLGLEPFDGFGGALYLNGVSSAIVTSIDFNLENGLDGNTYVLGGQGARRWLPEGIAKITGTVTLLFEDDAYTFYANAKAFTETMLWLTMTAGTGAGTASNEKMSIYMNEVIFKPEAPAVAGPTGVTISAPFEAFYTNDSSATALKVVIESPTDDYDDTAA